jgi:hypothetical protein
MTKATNVVLLIGIEPLPWALEAGSQSDIPKEPGSETLIAATRQHRRFWSAIAGRRIQKSCADG